MAIAEFPLWALPMFNGYSETVEPVVYRTEFEAGPKKQRSYQCGQEVQKSYSFHICGCSRMKEFRDFFVNDLANGSLWFKFYDPCEEKFVRARIPDHTYTAVPDNKSFDSWTVSLNIETMVYRGIS